MKKLSGIIIVSIVVLVFFSSFAADLSAKKNSPTSKGVYLYTKPNFKGFCYWTSMDQRQLPTSSYKTSPRTAYVNFDNSVSSIRLVGINNIAV
ncbi:MAG: hypothetical protein KAR14_01995, partial [Candidatus Aminicenantes bacterium]|nr:hypothetical protein [Candidatus Aminicenantes bacterium]